MKPIDYALILTTAVASLGSASAATLTYTTGLDVWLDSSDIDGAGNTTLTEGDNIGTWTNKGTTGANNATRNGGTASFSTTSGVGGGAGVTLSNSLFQFGGDFTDSTSYTMYFMVERSATSGAGGTLFNDYGPGNSLLMVRTGDSGSGARDAGGDQDYIANGPSVDVDDTLLTLKFTLDGSTGDITWGPVGSTTSATIANYDGTDFTTDHPTTLFGFWDGNNSHDFNGTISQVLIYDHVLDAGQQAQVESYLASVPEPSSAALLGLGGVALLLRRRK